MWLNACHAAQEGEEEEALVEAVEEGQEEEQAQEEEEDDKAAEVIPSATCSFTQAWDSCTQAQPARAALADSPGCAEGHAWACLRALTACAILQWR